MTHKTQIDCRPVWIGPYRDERISSGSLRIGVQIGILDETLEFCVEYVPGNATLGDLADGLYRLCDRTVEIVRRDVERRGQSIPCRKGCCATCCRHLIPVSVAEAASLGRYLLGNPQANGACIERFRGTAGRVGGEFERFKAQVNIEGMEFGELSQRLNAWYEEARIDCPMLVDEACCIYEYRPMICRQWGVIGSEEQCMTGTTGKKYTMPRPINYSDILREVGVRLGLFGNETVLLPFVLEWYEANREKCEKQIATEELINALLDVFSSKLKGKIKITIL